MNINDRINTYFRIVPMIYAYTVPGVSYRDGWTKIGYTEKQTVEQRIKQQTHTAGITPKIEWKDNALFKDGSGETFTDHEFHNFLTRRANIHREQGTEWFEIGPTKAKELFEVFSSKEEFTLNQGSTYILRKEQEEAVNITKNYFENGGKEFLWNAKPRFGKTLAAYDLIQSMGLKKVLIVTNRPSIANSWLEDFIKFVGWHNEYLFVSESETMKSKSGVYSRSEFQEILYQDTKHPKGMIAFESLQGLKGSKYFGGFYDKLHWLTELDFDLLVIDESHEGVDTYKTDKALRQVKRKFTLYLSGTPFKALAGEQFRDDQIFNWSYSDEQEAKENWEGEDYNPYEKLPKLNMFTYQMSKMIEDRVEKGANLEEDEFVSYTFDLNEFFKTNDNGKFIHEKEIRKFLNTLTKNEKYPFSTTELRDNLKHTLWLLNRVDSVKALAKLLKENEIFKDYEIVIAAGDGRLNEEDELENSYNKVKKAISENDKTITLSVGQLTTGVTIPEWSGVLMLSSIKSPSLYMQAAFRAQNPYSFIDNNGKHFMKENAYVFDFDPARTLTIFDEFANNLIPESAGGKGTQDDRKQNIKKLLNFFPVIGEDNNGVMVELNENQILTIPRKLKSQEVVRRGFLSNFLFNNITNIFGAPEPVKEIIQKIVQVKDQPTLKENKKLEKIDEISVDEEGEVSIPNEIIIGKSKDLFGEKIFDEVNEKVIDDFPKLTIEERAKNIEDKVEKIVSTVQNNLDSEFFEPAASEYKVTKARKKKIQKKIENDIKQKFEEIKDNYLEQEQLAKAELEYQQNIAKKLDDSEKIDHVIKAEDEYRKRTETAIEDLTNALKESTEQFINEKPSEFILELEKAQANQKKEEIEEVVRHHLRGFSRTIPSFIMAYGDRNLNLNNFDDYTEDDVFEQVTGISEEEFRLLRDGGDITNTETGEIDHFKGHLFNEIVFNDSIQEFLDKKEELADYFNEDNVEDIFDYIPPQRTNQIFTPKMVVKKMVDKLEEQNPDCFDNPDKTFADLYMKSGLYIAEIVKRLYQNENMKKAIPDNKERIKHILEKQVYGMAPTRIIYLIATNYILGFDESLRNNTKNFVEADAAKAANNQQLQELVDSYFENFN